jgi:hypothetical protein
MSGVCQSCRDLQLLDGRLALAEFTQSLGERSINGELTSKDIQI